MEYDEVMFYSAKVRPCDEIGDDEASDWPDILSLAEDFFDRFSDNSILKEEVDLIYLLLDDMGRNGASKDFFRHENRAGALPSPSNKLLRRNLDPASFQPLRLYVMRISEDVVFLFNGDVKTTEKAQDCPNVSRHFRLANSLAMEIDEAIKNRDIIVGHKSLSFHVDYLYLSTI